MIDIDEVISKFSDKIPPKFKALSSEYRDFLKESLQSLLKEQGLVTREEYDIQCQVLQRIQDKVAILEAQIKKMDKQ